MEQWKTVIYKDEIYSDYEVSTEGRIRSLGNDKTRKTRLLKQSKDGCGYLKVRLYKNGKSKTIKVHILVAYTFIPNLDNLPEVDHINRNRQDNRVENLRWADRKIQFGNWEGRKKRVLCVETGIIYESCAEASRKTGLSQGNICNCCNGKKGHKTCGGFHWEYVD